MSSVTPRERLEQWRAQLSRVFRRSLDRHDRTQAEVAQAHLEHLRNVICECSDVQRDYASALVGGITRPEREALRREISEVISALAKLDHALKIEGEREAAAFGGPRGIA